MSMVTKALSLLAIVDRCVEAHQQAVFIACNDLSASEPYLNHVHALDPESGTERWSADVRSNLEQPYTIAAGSFLTMSSWDEDMQPNKSVTARSMEDGSVLWTHPVAPSCGNGFLMGATMDVYYLLCNEDPANFTLDTILAHSIEDGSLKRTFTFPGEQIRTFWALMDYVYVLADSCGEFPPRSDDPQTCGHIYAITPDADSFYVSWTYSTGAPGWNLAGTWDLLIVTSRDGRVHAINTSDGTAKWVSQSTTPDEPEQWYPWTPYTLIGAPAVSKDGTSVYVFDTKGALSLDVVDGKQRFHSKWAHGNPSRQCSSMDRPLQDRTGEHIFGFNGITAGDDFGHGVVTSILTVDGNFTNRVTATSADEFEGPCPQVNEISEDGSLIFVTVQKGTFNLHALDSATLAKSWEFKCPRSVLHEALV